MAWLLLLFLAINNRLFVKASTLGSAMSSSLAAFEDIICTTCNVDADCGGGEYYCDQTAFVCARNSCSDNSDCGSGYYCWRQRCCDSSSSQVTSSICVTDVCNSSSTTSSPATTGLTVTTNYPIGTLSYINANSSYYNSSICGTNNHTYSTELELLCHDTCVSHYGNCSTAGGSSSSLIKKILNKISFYFSHYLYYSIGVVVLACICLTGCSFCCFRYCCRRRRAGGILLKHDSGIRYAV